LLLFEGPGGRLPVTLDHESPFIDTLENDPVRARQQMKSSRLVVFMIPKP
jgi:hypothetical protein